jgi:hypothetical protein
MYIANSLYAFCYIETVGQWSVGPITEVQVRKSFAEPTEDFRLMPCDATLKNGLHR